LNPVWIANAITGARGRGRRVPDALTQSLTERPGAPLPAPERSFDLV
jgi:hypothetical protein